MKISIFEKWYSLGVDYSNRKDCLWVFEITEQDKIKLEKWASYEIANWKLNIIETEEYLEVIKKEEKELDFKKYFDLKKKASDLRQDYLLFEMSETPLAIKKREIITNQTAEIATQMEAIATDLVNKYGEEILLEL